MSYEYYMNPPNAVKFSRIKDDISNGVIPSLSPFHGTEAKPGEFYIDDAEGNVLYMQKFSNNVLFAETYYSNYAWKILQKLMRHYGFKVNIEGLLPEGEDTLMEADDFEGWDNFTGSGKFNSAPQDYADVYKNGAGVRIAPMPRQDSGEWGRKYRYIKYRETNGKVSRIQ